MYSTVQPFQVVNVVSVPKPRAFTIPERVVPPAYIRWGQASNFDQSDIRTDTLIKLKEEPKPRPTIFGKYTEEARTWTDFKYANPEDASQFVILRKINQISFRALPASSFSDDRRGEQVTFQFTSSFTPDHERSYLKNKAGDEFAPLVLDPLHTIREVGWGGPFAILVFTYEPSITGFATNAGTENIGQLHLTQPGVVNGEPSSDIFSIALAGYGDPDIDALVVYPRGEDDIKKQWVRGIFQGSYIGTDDPGEFGTSSRFVSIVAWYINVAEMRKQLFSDLADEEQPCFELTFRYGGTSLLPDQQGSPLAYIGYGYYDSSLRTQLEGSNYSTALAAAMEAVSPASRTAIGAIDIALGLLGSFKQSVTVAGSVDMTDSQFALPPTSTANFDHYVFRDNYPNVIEDF